MVPSQKLPLARVASAQMMAGQQTNTKMSQIGTGVQGKPAKTDLYSKLFGGSNKNEMQTSKAIPISKPLSQQAA